MKHGKGWWTMTHHRRSSSVHTTYTEVLGRSRKALKCLREAASGVGTFGARKGRQIKKAIGGVKGGVKRVGKGKPAATRAALKVVAVAPVAIVAVAVAGAASGGRGKKESRRRKGGAGEAEAAAAADTEKEILKK